MDIGGADNDDMDTQNPASGSESLGGNTEDLNRDSGMREDSDNDYDDFYRYIKEGVKTVTELEAFVKSALIQECKLDACVEPLLQCLSETPNRRAHLFDFRSMKAEDKEKLENIVEEMRSNINRLLQGYLEDPTITNVLSDRKLKEKLNARWNQYEPRNWRFDPEPLKQRHNKSTAFHRSLLDVLMPQFCNPDSGPTPATTAPSLTKLAFGEVCRHLEDSIAGERAAAAFVCGGSVSTVASPVRLFWAKSENANEAHQLVLPLNATSTEESSLQTLHQLVADCDAASFGRGQQDVMDLEYRRAGKLDPCRFVSNFSPADCGILHFAEQILLPNFNTGLENNLPFRRLKAELYKLNIYSGPSGLFKKHVDTPRSEHQIGSLVVCLPSPFQGGKLVVRHEGREVDFDWGPQSASTIQWAAFYSDCEHEIMTITEGERLTLTYNLFATEVEGGPVPRLVTDPTKLPLWSDLKSLIGQPGFMKDGGVLGFYCSHAYPHASKIASKLLPRGLKGADLALFSVLKSLGLEVDVRPVLKNRWKSPEYDEGGNEAEVNMRNYLEKGTPFKPALTQVPRIVPLDEDVDRQWKTLYLSRRALGMGELRHLVPKDRLKEFDKHWNCAKLVGTELNEFKLTDCGGEGMGITRVINGSWAAQRLPGVTWLGKPKHQEMAFGFMTYGNEASNDCMYSYAAILAAIPPFDKRGDIIRRLH